MLFDVGTYYDDDFQDRGSDWSLNECGELVHEDFAHELIAELQALEVGQCFWCGSIEIRRIR